MSTTTASMHLMRCPACNNDVNATVTYKLDFDGPRPEREVTPQIEATVTVTAKVSGIKVFHDCRDGKPTLAEQLRATAGVAK